VPLAVMTEPCQKSLPRCSRGVDKFPGAVQMKMVWLLGGVNSNRPTEDARMFNDLIDSPLCKGTMALTVSHHRLPRSEISTRWTTEAPGTLSVRRALPRDRELCFREPMF